MNQLIILDDLSKQTIFLYVCVFIAIVCTFKKINIKINMIFGVCLACGILTYLYLNKLKEHNQFEKNKINKIELIKPSLKKYNDIASYDKITNYLFSIQDFYYSNPLVYSDCVDSINKFFICYKESLNNEPTAGENFNQMKFYKQKSLSDLDKIIFGLELNVEYDGKLILAKKNLEIILNDYLEEIYEIHQQYIYKHGITNATKFIYKNEIPAYNEYENENDNFDKLTN